MDPTQLGPLEEVFKLARPYKVKQSATGPVEITAEHLQACVDCQDHMISAALEAQGVPQFVSAKVDHVPSTITPVMGEFKRLWVDPATRWLTGLFHWASAEAMEWAHLHGLSKCSIEIAFDREVYGTRFPARLEAVSLVPVENYPAIPGAGSTRAVASGAGSELVVRLTCGEDEPDTESGEPAALEGDTNMDEKLAAAIAQLSEGLAGVMGAVNALTAKVDAIATGKETEAAEAAKAAEAATASAEAASLEAFSTKLSAAVTAGRVTQGEAEELTEVAKATSTDGRAKLSASLDKRPVVTAPAELMPNGKDTAKLTAEERADEGRKLVTAKLAANPSNYTAAVLAAKAERPELFAIDVKESE